MNIKSTRSTTDFTQTTIDLNKNEKTQSLGHDLDDRRSAENDQKYQSLVRQQLNLIQKFDGCGNPKH
ncbi:unnamed protein product [Rotaria sp. Silwood2]|nr:unnamed protein product [Rotaria sp. Silwood2]CAF4612451.1 unnamed protein product [Rotaria sp. Silwood2]